MDHENDTRGRRPVQEMHFVGASSPASEARPKRRLSLVERGALAAFVVCSLPVAALLALAVWSLWPGVFVVGGILAAGLLAAVPPQRRWLTALSGVACGLVVVSGVGGVALRYASSESEATRFASEMSAATAERAQANVEARRAEWLVRSKAPEVAAAWREAADAYRGSIVTGELAAVPGQPGECPAEVDECADAAEYVEGVITATEPLQRYLAASEMLDGFREHIESRRIIRRDQYASWEQVSEVVSSPPEDCPATLCTRERRQLHARLTQKIRRRRRDVIRPMDSIQAMRLAHADLSASETMVQLDGTLLRATTYHNCAFGSRARWRAFRLTEGFFSAAVHAYCRRGQQWCDNLYSEASSRTLNGTAVVVYPRHNDVCHENQVEIVSYISGAR